MMAFITENGEGPTATLPAPKHRLPQCKYDPNPWMIIHSTDLKLLAKDWIGIQAFLIWRQEVANFGVLRLFFYKHFDLLQRGSIASSMISVSLWNKLADHLSHNSSPESPKERDLVPIESVYYKLDLRHSTRKLNPLRYFLLPTDNICFENSFSILHLQFSLLLEYEFVSCLSQKNSQGCRFRWFFCLSVLKLQFPFW